MEWLSGATLKRGPQALSSWEISQGPPCGGAPPRPLRGQAAAPPSIASVPSGLAACLAEKGLCRFPCPEAALALWGPPWVAAGLPSTPWFLPHPCGAT